MDKSLASLGIRIASCFLISVAVLSHGAVGKNRSGLTQPPAPARCKLGAQQMRMVIDSAMAQREMITDAEKAFVRVQHEQLSCNEYTRLFERTNYYRSSGKREAMTKWHWEVYHSHTENSWEAAAPVSETGQ